MINGIMIVNYTDDEISNGARMRGRPVVWLLVPAKRNCILNCSNAKSFIKHKKQSTKSSLYSCAIMKKEY
jgi:hypothetical protein